MVELEECPRCKKPHTAGERCHCDIDDIPYYKLDYRWRHDRERSLCYD